MCPEYSARMLNLFITARIVNLMLINDWSLRQARAFEYDHLTRLSGVGANGIDAARSGLRNQHRNAARIWRALGYEPIEEGKTNGSI